MVNGVFRKTNRTGLVTMICGALLFGISLLLSFVLGIVAGAFLCLEGMILFFFNQNAVLIIGNDRIKGKFHWFGKINCAISDVTFAQAQHNTLHLYLISGKRYSIMGISNSYELARVLRRQIEFDITDTPDSLIEHFNQLRSTQKKGVIQVCALALLMFVILFMAVLLTDGKDMNEFLPRDWWIMAVMGILELATVVAAFLFANKYGKLNLPIVKQRYIIRKAVIENEPLPSGNMIKVYTEEDYCYRVVVYGYPNDEAVYFIAQAFAADFKLTVISTSDIYENIEMLSEELKEWRDITDRVVSHLSEI